ncbi:DUF3261 domain-containing protein [Pseudoalteromonas sp. CO302Y]|uniref:DUF3261 domain-containing protein n=1 Tax=unclassified Pseudoalteromonas TaxID=194690 RepID=UPI001022F8E3|nr:DUF3261 domain-containing protein [Pseudoalteromonas sp. CO302Y]RZG06451.1 DUF3261 domain-containing protein [Pseudoalteromonas sp. CO133X]
MSAIMRYVIVVFSLFLVSCANEYAVKTGLDLAPNAGIYLSDPPVSLDLDNWQQVLQVTHGAEQYTLLAQLNLSSETGINLVVMTVQGMPIFQLEKAPLGAVKSEKMLPISAVDPRYILADIMLVHWPIDVLNSQLYGLVIDEQGATRRLYQGKRLISEIQFLDSQTKLVNYERDYSIIFQRVN